MRRREREPTGGDAAITELLAALAADDGSTGGGSGGDGNQGGCVVADAVDAAAAVHAGAAGAPTRPARERGRPYVPRTDGDVDDTIAGAIDRTERPRPLDEEVRAMSGDGGPNRLRRGPVERRRNPPGSQTAADPCIPLALSDFHDLRRLGLFGDDGRNPPPSWWTR